MLEKKASQVAVEHKPEPVRSAAATTMRATSRPKAAQTQVDSKVTVKTLSATKLADSLYYYQAVVRSVYDGDTLTVDIDLGMNNWVHGEKLRLLRINTPEVKGETRAAGFAARDFLRSLIDGKTIVIETYKDDKEKYGRYLAEVWVQDDNKRYFNVNDRMVKEGHAEYKEY
jgi:micrococcal nuclease